MRLHLSALLLVAAFAGSALAKLPPPGDDAKAKAAETAAKSAWTDKVGAFQLCKALDRVAQAYRDSAKAAGKSPSAADPTPPCADPGPFAYSPPAADKPLEASGAHSPAATATSPPSTNATAAQTAPKK